MQKGFAGILILVGILVLAGVAGGAFYVGRSIIQGPLPVQNPNVSEIPQFTPNLSPSAIPKSLLPQITENNENLTPETAKQIIPLDKVASKAADIDLCDEPATKWFISGAQVRDNYILMNNLEGMRSGRTPQDRDYYINKGDAIKLLLNKEFEYGTAYCLVKLKVTSIKRNQATILTSDQCEGDPETSCIVIIPR